MILDNFIGLIGSFLTDSVIAEIIYPFFGLAFLVTVPAIIKFVWR